MTVVRWRDIGLVRFLSTWTTREAETLSKPEGIVASVIEDEEDNGIHT